MAHPFNTHRQHDVERSRVGKITKGYASGGAVLPESNAAVRKSAIKQRDAQAVEGGSVKERQDRPGRKSGGRVKRAAGGVADTGNRGVADLTSNADAAQQARENAAARTSQSVLKLRQANDPIAGRARGGRAPKHKGNNVNVIIAPQGGAHPPMAPGAPPPGVAAGPPPMPPRPAMAPPGPPPGMAGPGMPPPGMPPRSAGGRAYATGGAVSGAAWKEGLKAGTQVQNNPSGKSDQKNVNRGKVITYKTGGAVTSENGPMGPKFDGGAGGGTARKQKEARAGKKYAKAK